jgi:hypothetical protein
MRSSGDTHNGKRINLNRSSALLAIAPSLLMVWLFYSLALHMRLSLGALPTSIGEAGFPALLRYHAHIATHFFVILAWASMFVWPLLFILCLAVRGWRIFVPNLILYAISYAVCWSLILLAPSRFLNWWWD